MSEQDAEDQAPGWDAITRALKPIYADQDPQTFGAAMKWTLGGSDPLDGISAFKRLQPMPHWHYISYGLTELYDKQSDNAAVSGHGYEFTFRVACDADASAPPRWPMAIMQNLTRYVVNSGNDFAEGHWINLNAPMVADSGTQICTVAFVQDPELPPIDTANGSVQFLQIVGLTQDEEDAGKQWSIMSLLAACEPYMPLFITDLGRPSMMGHVDIVAAHSAGIAKHGSSTEELFTDVLDWEAHKIVSMASTATVTIGMNQVKALLNLLPARLPHGRSLRLVGREKYVTFRPGDKDNIVVNDDKELVVTFTSESLEDLSMRLEPAQGSYTIAGLKLTIDVQ